MIGAALRAIRLTKKLSQVEMARLVGVAPTQYSSWENDRHEPRGESLVRLCKTLGMEPGELLGYRLEVDAEMQWCWKNLLASERVVVLDTMKSMIRQREAASGVGEAVVRPAADAVVVAPGAMPERVHVEGPSLLDSVQMEPAGPSPVEMAVRPEGSSN